MELPRDGHFGSDVALIMDKVLSGITSKKIQGIAEGEALRLASIAYTCSQISDQDKVHFITEAKTGKFFPKELQSGQVGSLALAGALKRVNRELAISECTFVDLGSGDGRQVLLAALLYPFSKIKGVEVLPALHNLALSSLNRMREIVQPYPSQSVSFHQADIVSFDWLDADVVLLNWVCFPVTLRDQILTRAAGLKQVGNGLCLGALERLTFTEKTLMFNVQLQQKQMLL